MASADGAGLAALLEALEGVVADRRQHPEARLAVGLLRLAQKALVDELAEALEEVHADVGAGDGLDLVEAPATGEDTEAREQPPLRLAKEVPAPGDRAAQRALAFGQVARPGRQQVEARFETRQDRLR